MAAGRATELNSDEQKLSAQAIALYLTSVGEALGLLRFEGGSQRVAAETFHRELEASIQRWGQLSEAKHPGVEAKLQAFHRLVIDTADKARDHFERTS